MSLTEFTLVGELVASIAVVITLVFLTIQLKMNTNTVRGEMELESARMFTEWHARISASPAKQKLWDRGSMNDEMSPEDASDYLWMIVELFFLIEGVYRQHKRGLVSDGSFQPLAAMASALKNDNRYVKAWWDDRLGPISREFRDFMNSDHPFVSGPWRMPSTAEMRAAGEQMQPE